MTDKQRKYALAEIDKILGAKEAQLVAERKIALDKIPWIDDVYADVLEKNKAEQRALIEAMVYKLRHDSASITLATISTEGRTDLPRLAKVREAYEAKRKVVNDAYEEKADALRARAEQLRRQIMLADLPPQALNMLTEFEAESI